MRIPTLDRKLLRELYQQRGPLFAICLVISGGIATFVTNRSVLGSLVTARAQYYQDYGYADLYASLVRAPERIAERLAAVPGVRTLETRIAANVVLDVPGVDEIVTGQLVSLPESGEPPRLNAIHLERGRLPVPQHRDEVVLSSVFADANELELGDTFRALIHQRYQELRVVGIGMSPEYVYAIPPGSIVPDNRLFGIVWIGRETLAHAFDLDGAFNDIVARFDRGARRVAVLRDFDHILEPYGGLGAYTDEVQFSNWYLESEFQQLGRTGTIVPFIFLGVAAFLLNIFLTRLLAQQREAIAVLKAFGYTNLQVGIHFVKLVILVVVLACVFGALAGRVMGSWMIDLYAEYFVFPDLAHRLTAGQVLNGGAVALIAALLGTLKAVHHAVRIPPAEAMRPPAPTSYRRAFWERWGLGNHLPMAARMVLRSAIRQPMKSSLSIIGIAAGTSLLVTGNSMMDSMNFGIETQFQRAQREDATLSLIEPRTSLRTMGEIAHLPGVLSIEPYRSVAVRIRAGHRERRMSLEGVPEGRTLRRLLDADRNPVEVPPKGLLFSGKLAEVLGVEVGDVVRLEVLEGSRPEVSIPVAATFSTYFGMGVYMEIGELNRILGEGPALTGALLAVDARHEQALHDALKETPAVAGLGLRSEMLRNFEETAKKSFSVMSLFTYTFALIIALGVVYNNARIILSERSRELASLRVLGYRRREISQILLGEIGLLTVLAIPVGFALGVLLSALLMRSIDSELYRLPSKVSARTFASAALTILIGSTVAGLWVRRHLDRLDLVAVLKTRE